MRWVADLRYVFRALARSPGFALAAVGTLALSVAAVTAMFSTVNGVVLRPLPFPEAERLVALCERHPSVAGFCIGSPPNAADWADRSRTLAAIGVARDWPFLIRDERGSQVIDGGIASAHFFRVFGTVPAVGRLFGPDDVDASRVVVLSHGLWRSRFGGDTAVVGTTITLDDEAHLVVGILPPDVAFPTLEGVNLWAPLPFDQRLEENREWRGFRVFGRMAARASRQRVGEELAGVALRLAEEHPATNQGWTVEVLELRSYLVGSVGRTLLLLLGAVGFVLLIGCANVANLLLARISHRGRELAVRAALGATRWASARLVLLETAVLAALGGALGLVLSLWTLQAFLRLAPPSIPRLAEVSVDGRVFAFALAVSVATSVLVGTAGFLQAARSSPSDVLRGTNVAPGGRFGPRGALVVAEIALALVLLTGAGLAMRSFIRMASWDPGFETGHVTTTWLLASDSKYPTRPQVADLFRQAVDEVRAIPGVVSAGAASAGPLFGGTETDAFEIVGRPRDAAHPPTARWFDVDPHYFATLGIPVTRGRPFEASDVLGAAGVAIVNQTMAQRYWPGEDPLGQQVVMYGRTMTVIGVVRDVPPLRRDEAPQPEVYWPNQQAPRWATYLVLRTSADPAAIERVVRQRLEALDPDLSVSAFRPMTAQLTRSLVYPRFVTTLVGGFAAIALVLAAIGVYGVIAYGVAQRTREIGIQAALGATRGAILRKVITQGMSLTLAGLAIGVAGSLALGPVLASLLAGVEPRDPATLLAVSLVLALVALIASYLPARRASGVSAMEALRTV